MAETVRGRRGSSLYISRDTFNGISEAVLLDTVADERAAVFEAGHSLGTNGTGFGSGIAEQVADAHDWDIRATEGTDGGARFEITGVETVTE